MILFCCVVIFFWLDIVWNSLEKEAYNDCRICDCKILKVQVLYILENGMQGYPKIITNYLSYYILLIYSYSQLKLYQECPLLYKKRYIDKDPRTKTTSLEQYRGIAMHKSLEIYRSQYAMWTRLSCDDLINTFVQDFTRRVVYKKDSFVIEGDIEESIQYEIDRTTQWLRHYRQNNIEDEQYTTQYWLEKRIYWHLWPHTKNNFMWIIDRIATSDKWLIVIDYKWWYSEERLNISHDQVMLYTYLLQQQGLHVYWYRIDFVIGQKVVEYTIDTKEVEKIADTYMQVISAIEWEYFQLQFNDPDAFSPTKCSQCDSCPLRQHCPLRLWKS